jgi:hypothetical protein
MAFGNHPIRTFFVAASTAVLVGAASCGAPAPQAGGHPWPEAKVCGTIGANPIRVPDEQCMSLSSPYVWYVGKYFDLDYDDYTPIGSRLDDDYLGYQQRPVIVQPPRTIVITPKPTPRPTPSVRPAPTPKAR